ncbi:MAG: nickel pincer cofactor biosynthesis protein LarB [Desulfovibrio sp.]|jgi:NCAIR mutase (PurE)-related protein|nr:nickel pincer cofactor biosynthesis protein LarB [Desulfovibrio sp.]
METVLLRDILALVAEGRLAPDAALERVCDADVRATLGGFASRFQEWTPGLMLDPERGPRAGVGEVVFAEGKSDDLLFAALEGLSRYGPALASRVTPAQGEALRARFPEGRHWQKASLFALNAPERFMALAGASTDPALPAADGTWPRQGDVLVVSAGASDMSVALEALGSLAFLDCDAGLVSDVGVSGLHRLLPHIEALRKAKAVIAVAGMEGALPGVLAGIIRAPVVAVPTSVGYGVGAGGFAALTTMLCTCVPGVAVVNINNGFGAAAFAAKILFAGGRKAS